MISTVNSPHRPRSVNRPVPQVLVDRLMEARYEAGYAIGRAIYDAMKRGDRCLAAEALIELRAVVGMEFAFQVERHTLGPKHERIAAALLAEDRTSID
jgi:hypothetical protein